jgi:hypothetical protein
MVMVHENEFVRESCEQWKIVDTPYNPCTGSSMKFSSETKVRQKKRTKWGYVGIIHYANHAPASPLEYRTCFLKMVFFGSLRRVLYGKTRRVSSRHLRTDFLSACFFFVSQKMRSRTHLLQPDMFLPVSFNHIMMSNLGPGHSLYQGKCWWESEPN